MSAEPHIDQVWYDQLEKVQALERESVEYCDHCESDPVVRPAPSVCPVPTVCDDCQNQTLELTHSEALYLKQKLAKRTIAESAFDGMHVKYRSAWHAYPEGDDGRRLVHDIYLSEEQVNELYYQVCRKLECDFVVSENKLERLQSELYGYLESMYLQR
jgi:hypothetical protein